MIKKNINNEILLAAQTKNEIYISFNQFFTFNKDFKKKIHSLDINNLRKTYQIPLDYFVDKVWLLIDLVYMVRLVQRSVAPHDIEIRQ